MNIPRIIYALVHEPTGKIYIGSTENLTHRINVHLYALRRGDHDNKRMQADYNEFGGGYYVYTLDVIRDFKERDREFLWMDALNSRSPDHGYNSGDHSRPRGLNDKPFIFTTLESEKIRGLKHDLERMENDALHK